MLVNKENEYFNAPNFFEENDTIIIDDGFRHFHTIELDDSVRMMLGKCSH